jgi:hypothetical protein
MAELADWKVLVSLFPEGWEQLGRSSGAVRRLRGFATTDALLHSLLLHVGCGLSLRETAVQAKMSGLAAVSDVTLLKRLRNAEVWLRQMCEQILREQGVDLSAQVAGFRIRLLDGSVIKEPGKTGSQWRLHYSLRLPTLECDQFVLTSTKGHGTGERFGRFSLGAGDLALADAGFCNPAGVEAVVAQQADVCVRLNPASLPLFYEDGTPFALAQALAGLDRPAEVAAWPVWVHAGEQILPGRLCAIRKSEAAIQQAQRRIRDKRRRQIKIGPLAELCSRYVLVFTTLGEAQADAAKVLELYRLRWQIELSFKRLKSLAGLGHLPKYDDRSSRAWLYGKLFLALLTEKMMRLGKSFSPWGYMLAIPSAQQAQQVA